MNWIERAIDKMVDEVIKAGLRKRELDEELEAGLDAEAEGKRASAWTPEEALYIANREGEEL